LFVEPILDVMQNRLMNYDIGVVGCQLRNHDSSLQYSYHDGDRIFRNLLRRNPFSIKFLNATKKNAFTQQFIETSHYVEHTTRWISGACMMFRKSEIINNKWFWDEKFFMYWEDVELCYRIRKTGKKILYLPNVTLIHIGGGGETNFSFKRFSLMEQSKLMFIEKTSGKWKRNLYTFLMRQEIRFERFLEQKKAKNRSLPILEKEIEFYLQEKKS
jgi:GT2 family glycosyltransferase